MTDCAQVRLSLGSYVLGGLEPAERSRLEAHLDGCPACRDELAAMAGMPALLGRVDEAQIAQVAAPPPETLDALLARTATERRRGVRARLLGMRLWWAPLAAAASVLLIAGAVVGGLAATAGPDDPVAAPPSATSAPPADEGRRVAASDPGTSVDGWAMLYDKKWGTEVELHLAGAPAGADCRLYAVARDGRRDVLGSWHVPYSKGYGSYTGSTMFTADELAAFEIVTMDGRRLLKIPA